MIISVDLYDAKPVYQQITESVRNAIARGSLKAGDRLPPIRETAVQTRVNRNTVSRAYLELEHQGLVQARQGSGFYVAPNGIDAERTMRRQAIIDLIDTLVAESSLADIETDELVKLIRKTAEKVGDKEQ